MTHTVLLHKLEHSIFNSKKNKKLCMGISSEIKQKTKTNREFYENKKKLMSLLLSLVKLCHRNGNCNSYCTHRIKNRVDLIFIKRQA